MRPADGGFLLETGGGRAYGIDAAVLALGNFPPDQRQAPGYYGDPWHPQAVRDLIPGRPVLLIGTGLTMVDVCLALLGEGFAGPVYALSRRGCCRMRTPRRRAGTGSSCAPRTAARSPRCAARSAAKSVARPTWSSTGDR